MDVCSHFYIPETFKVIREHQCEKCKRCKTCDGNGNVCRNIEINEKLEEYFSEELAAYYYLASHDGKTIEYKNFKKDLRTGGLYAQRSLWFLIEASLIEIENDVIKVLDGTKLLEQFPDKAVSRTFLYNYNPNCY